MFLKFVMSYGTSPRHRPWKCSYIIDFTMKDTKLMLHWNPGGGGGGEGMSHWGLYIIRVNPFLKSTLHEDEATVPTAPWTLHRACAPGYRSQISYPFHGLSVGSVNLIPFFSYFPVFETLNAIRALWAGWRKRYPFYAFLLTWMMYRPQWDMPPRDWNLWLTWSESGGIVHSQSHWPLLALASLLLHNNWSTEMNRKLV